MQIRSLFPVVLCTKSFSARIGIYCISFFFYQATVHDQKPWWCNGSTLVNNTRGLGSNPDHAYRVQ